MIECVTLRATRLRHSNEARRIRAFERFVLEQIAIGRVYYTLQSRLDRGKNLIVSPRSDSLERGRHGGRSFKLWLGFISEFGHNTC
jgi:hypothetical protein